MKTDVRFRLSLVTVTVSLGILLLASGRANAQGGSATVTSTNDDNGPGTLRNAINAMNALPPPGGTVVFAADVRGSIVLTNGELDITNSLSILGPGANLLAVDGSGTNRVFVIRPPF